MSSVMPFRNYRLLESLDIFISLAVKTTGQQNCDIESNINFKKIKRIQNGSYHILCGFSIFSNVFVVLTTTKSVLAS